MLCLHTRREHRKGICPPGLTIQALLREEEHEEEMRVILPHDNRGMPIMAEALVKAGLSGIQENQK